MKNLTKSKTIIFNVLTVIVVFATYFGYDTNTQLAEQTQAIILALAPLINLLLRARTYEAVNI